MYKIILICVAFLALYGCAQACKTEGQAFGVAALLILLIVYFFNNITPGNNETANPSS